MSIYVYTIGIEQRDSKECLILIASQLSNVCVCCFLINSRIVVVLANSRRVARVVVRGINSIILSSD